jgi:PAS domain S-box-containing protein
VTLKPARIAGEPRILAFTRDITERKLADQALRASEEQYRAIFIATADALVLRDANFRVVDVNPAYVAMTGYAREEVLNVDRVVANPPEMNGLIRGLHSRALAGEPTVFETELIRKNGTRFDLELRAVSVQYRGRPHVLYIGRDISSRKRAEAERAALEAQLRQAQKMEAIGHLTGGIAHDFNNILTSVLGYVVLAGEREAARGDAKLPQYLDQARLSCERARDLIQQMLTVSRGKRGEPQPLSLTPVVQEATSLLRPSLPSTLELGTALETDLPSVMLDPVQAEQVLLNLCINARDAMNGHGHLLVGARRFKTDAAVCASCRSRIAGEFVALEVTDTGPGIQPEVMDRMFEPFYSTKEVGKGSGMGLSTTHGIVHEHGGHVVVETTLGQGTTFRVLFPMLAKSDAPMSPQVSKASAPSAPRVALSGHVLVIDDEEIVAGFMRELLESWGLQVTAFTSGVEARETFARAPNRYDLIVTDQTMPRITGLQLARELLGIRPSLPVILYTGYADELTEGEARAAGVRALLRKPVEPRDLLALLRANLPKRAQPAR